MSFVLLNDNPVIAEIENRLHNTMHEYETARDLSQHKWKICMALESQLARLREARGIVIHNEIDFRPTLTIEEMDALISAVSASVLPK